MTGDEWIIREVMPTLKKAAKKMATVIEKYPSTPYTENNLRELTSTLSLISKYDKEISNGDQQEHQGDRDVRGQDQERQSQVRG